MKRYFATNTLARATRNATNVLDGNTSAGVFNAAFVSSAISIPSVNTTSYFMIGAPFDEGSASISGFASLRLDYFTGGWNTILNFIVLLSAGVPVYQILPISTNNFQVQYWNSTTHAWVAWDSVRAALLGLNTHVWNLTPGVGFTYYVNGIAVSSQSAAPVSAAASFDEIRFYNSDGNSHTGISAYSQIMGADYDLRGSQMFSRMPNGEGTYTDGSGTFTDVNEATLNDANAIGLPLVGNKHSFTNAAFPALPTGLTIESLGVNGRVRVGGAVVSDGKLMVRSSSVDQDSTALLAPAGFTCRGRQFEIDPATGTKWVKAAADAAQVGLEAV
jgi:hypothetical protein